jgi:hypothetical protein
MNFECDSSVDENTRKLIGLPGAGAAATILRPECRILAVSTDHPRVKVFDPVKLDDKIAILSLRSMTEAETRTIAQAIAG